MTHRKQSLEIAPAGRTTRQRAGHLLATIIALAIAAPALAASPSTTGSGMPWEQPLDFILSSIQGPVARAFIIISIIFTGLGIAFGEQGSGFKKFMGIAFGGAIVVGVVSFVSTLFGATF